MHIDKYNKRTDTDSYFINNTWSALGYNYQKALEYIIRMIDGTCI